MKDYLFLLILFFAFISPAISEAAPGPSIGWTEDAKAECFYNDAGEFVLIGEFGEEARLCFARTYKKGTQIIRVNSEGGQASAGLALAYRLRGEKFHLIIEKQCSSSCAHYLIPAAHEVTLSKNSGIVLHGAVFDFLIHKKKYKKQFIQAGLDRGQSKSETKHGYREFKKNTKLQIEATEDNKDIYTIRDGWFMESGRWAINADKVPVKEDAVTWMQDNNTNGILVDRLFFESCLPNVKINAFYGPSHPEHVNNPEYQARIKKANLSVFPDAQCLP